LLIGEFENHRVRSLNARGQLQTIAGDGMPRFSGDGGPATQASLEYPEGVAVDAAGNIYIADSRNDRIRKIPAAAPARTVSGGPLSFTTPAGGAPTSPQTLSLASSIPGLAFAATGDPWIKISTAAG